jgi:acetyl esterase/lipase/predicted amidohydrolase
MRRLAALIALMVLADPLIATPAQEPSYSRKEDVIYGRKFGTALTMDVFTPRPGANGAGVILVVSGGFFSAHEAINPAFIHPLLDRGYAVFAIVHGSQPRYTVDEIVADLNRAVRFVRHHAREYGIDPGRIGVTGASAGGHLALMLGTAGRRGDPEAKDPVDRESSRVQAVACFFPPTDFLNFGAPGREMIHARDHQKPFRPAFDYRELDREANLWGPVADEGRLRRIAGDISPIAHVSPDDPPALIVHGDKDQLVPLQQSQTFVERLKGAGVEAKLVVKPGAGHGWPDMAKDLGAFADWFDAHLKAPEGGRRVAPAPGTKADRPPRKVIVGTVIFGRYGAYPGLDERLKALGGLIDRMARRAREQYPGRGLDLAILPEFAVTATSGPASARAIRLDGKVRETFAALARRHGTYIIAPMDLAEDGPKGTTNANAAVLFDRRGGVAGIYRKAHPVAVPGTDDLEGGITPGRDFPVFDCDFGRLGVQICWDVQFDDGWAALAAQGAEIVAWPSASPATAQPAARAARHRYYVVSSTWREDATVFEPTGLVAAQVEGREEILVHQLDLSYALLGWSAPLRDGRALTERYGDKVGYHYEPREDLGLFWSNDPQTTIGAMIRSLGLEEIDAQVERNRRLQDAARGGPVPRR